MNQELPILDGHMRDPQGRLVPINMVRPVDQERDRLIRELATKAKNLNAALTQFKGKAFGDVGAFVEMSAEEYGVKRGGRKGNLTLHTFDGAFKLQIQTAEAIRFDERLQAAKSLIDACAAEWSDGTREEVKIIIQEAFRADKEGNLSVGRVLGLQRWAITEPRWLEAMRAISESIQVTGSKKYIRFYERVGETDRYQAIPLDMVAI